MIHSFDVDIAANYGVNSAILLWHLYFWCAKNRANEKHFYDGLYWTYNSVKAYKELFPYMSRDQITNALKKLEDAGLIKEGNYNPVTYDRTKWYALTEAGWEVCKNADSISEKSENHLLKTRNGFTENPKPIPDNINTDINTQVNNKESDKSDSMSHSESVTLQIKSIIRSWNEMARRKGIAEISRLSPGSNRCKWLKTRIAEYGIDAVLEAIGNVGASDYLPDQHWFDFEWFVRQNNFPKVLEGKYGKAKKAVPEPAPEPEPTSESIVDKEAEEERNRVDQMSDEEYEEYFRTAFGGE